MYDYNIMQLNTNINIKNVEFYGYRQAQPKWRLISFDRNDRDIKQLEERLYAITKEAKDNHVLFAVKLDDCNVIALQFTDDRMILGFGVKNQNW